MTTHKIDPQLVREVYPEARRHEFLGIKNQDYDGHTQYLGFKEYEYGGDRHTAFTIPLAQFLFVDAWDYFVVKGWTILDNSHDGILAARRASSKIFWGKDYPSRLHAMAAAVAFIWKQEEKTNER